MSTPNPIDPYPKTKRQLEDEEKRRRDVPERPDKSRTPEDGETEEYWAPRTRAEPDPHGSM